MAEKKMYQGSCHCGKVSYEAMADLSFVLSCNCSFCSRTGAMLTFVTPDEFKLKTGEDVVTDYQFNKKVIHHLFCSNCGIRSFGRGIGPNGPMVALNVRCLDGVDLDSITPVKHDGKHA